MPGDAARDGFTRIARIDGIVVLAFGVNEHDLVAALGRERARDVRVLTRKELVDEEHAHALVPYRPIRKI